MKGRSNRPQSSDPPPDEWVDGSWTVDCICGVTFDDGEEMVKCDECGVWVHTRCSRYVKGDDMFACDKCKNKTNNNRAGVDNITEETEVAQLLVELPTKTISLQNNNSNINGNSFSSRVPASASASASRSRRPFKLWTDISMEERVHVQGIPGGDPSLFAGSNVSSIFGPQLWKCAGYVPKKFNFQYREFPSWGENENEDENEKKGVQENQKNGNDNDVDNDNRANGAGVLLSFSKETSTVMASPVSALVDMKSAHAKMGTKDKGTGNFAGNHVPRFHNAVKKERTLMRPFVVHSSKRRKDDLGSSNSKDRSAKKQRIKTSDREVDTKRRPPHFSKSASTTTSDSKQLASYEDRDPKVFKADTRWIKNKNLKDRTLQNHISNDSFAVDTIMEEPNNVTTTEESSEAVYPNRARRSHSAGDVLAEEKTGHKVAEMSSKTDDAVTSVLKHNDITGNASTKKKDGDCLESVNVDGTSVVRSIASPHTQGYCGSAPDLMDIKVSQDLDCNMGPSSVKCKVKVRKEDNDDNFKLSNFHSSPISDLNSNGKPSDHTTDIDKVNDAAVSSLPSCENKVGNVDISSEGVPDDHTNKPIELLGNFCHGKQEAEVSEGSLETHKRFSETKDGSEISKNLAKSEALECSRKMSAIVGKSSPTSSIVNSKLLSHDFKSEDTEIPSSFTKHGVTADCNIPIKNKSCSSDAAMDEIPRKSVRERSKSSLSSNSKGLHSTRSPQNSVSKQINSDVRDSVHCSSSKASLVHQTASVLGSSETSVSMHHQKASQVQNKVASSVPQKVEKLNQTNTHASTKLNQSHVPSVNPSPTANSSMLSDEELALLLHQELNSSPRVPRVPRARHPGSLPQLTSTSATSMLMKRTTVGGKDHSSVSRRKCKDAFRDGLGSSREPEDETKRIEKEEKEKGQSLADQRKHDMACVEDASVEEGGRASVTAANPITSKVVSTTSAIANSGPPSPPEDQNLSSIRNSPRNISDDDTETAGRPVHHTLPGLINDIMSKGRRMTYDELCNAVLPHWHNLRKHNGERYAYSSHSQAVLDCLRNRHEWSRLVDRGPKTNTNRKRRSKLDAEESDDNGCDKGKTVKEEEGKNFELQKEEFPKGKRKARKRRRLALQGRAVKDVRRQKANSLTEEDVGPFSNSSEESMFSEDEIQGSRIRPAESTSNEEGSADG